METPPRTDDDDRLPRRLALAIAVLAIVVRLFIAHTTHSTGEDALITLRYAENIAAGRGFVYNVGERVFGSTTPLYTLLLACAAALHLDALAVGKLCNIAADGVTCFLLARLLARREIGQPAAGLFAALWYALGSTPLSISISGMETGLVTCVGLAAVTAYVARRPRALAVLGALLYLLRIDGLLLFGILAGALILRERRVPWRDVALFCLLTLPWTLFAWIYFGSPIPTSLIAKLTVYNRTASDALFAGHFLRANIDAFRTQFAHGAVQILLTFLFLVGAARIALHARRAGASSGPAAGPNAAALAAPLLWLLGYYGIMLTSRVPAFGWYFLPPWPLVTAIAAVGADGIAARIGRYRPQWAESAGRPAIAALLLLTALAGLAHTRSVRRDIAAAQSREDGVRRPIGLWMRRNVGANERILLEPIGYIGYYSQRRIVDMIGLVSPEVLPSYRAPGGIAPLADIVARLRPEWLCLRPAEARELWGGATPSEEYRLVRTVYNVGPDPEVAFLLYARRK